MQLIAMYFYWNKSCSLLKKTKKNTKTNKHHMFGKINDKKAFQFDLHCISFFLRYFLLQAKIILTLGVLSPTYVVSEG